MLISHGSIEIPINEYYEHYGPDYELDVRSCNMEDMNTTEYLSKIKRAIYENLRDIDAAPSVQMHSESFRVQAIGQS